MRNSCCMGLAGLICCAFDGPAARRLDAQVVDTAAQPAPSGATGRLWFEDGTGGSAAGSLRPSLWAVAQPEHRRAVGWHHLGAGMGIVALASLLDDPLEDGLQARRSAGVDDVAALFRQVGEPEVYGTIGLGTIAAGLISGNHRITRAGGRITGSLLVAGTTVTLLKQATGRARPIADEPYRFRPLSGRDSWPSGHATMAFALAASVSDEIRSTPVTIALYSSATLTAWSRMNDNRHWLSDVLAGAGVGILSAKLMNGRWSVLGVRGPRFLLEPERVGVSFGI